MAGFHSLSSTNICYSLPPQKVTVLHFLFPLRAQVGKTKKWSCHSGACPRCRIHALERECVPWALGQQSSVTLNMNQYIPSEVSLIEWICGLWIWKKKSWMSSQGILVSTVMACHDNKWTDQGWIDKLSGSDQKLFWWTLRWLACFLLLTLQSHPPIHEGPVL